MREIEEGRRGARAPKVRSAGPAVDGSWPPVDRELSIVLEELPPASAAATPSGRGAASATASPRARAADHALLANGSRDWRAPVSAGEVVRLHLADAAPSRTFRLRLPGARVKLVGSGAGRVEREGVVEEVVLVPGDRAVVDVMFERPGEHRLEHRLPGRSLPVATFDVGPAAAPTRASDAFARLGTNPELASLRRALAEHLAREPDATIAACALTPGPTRALITASPRPKLRLINDASPRRPRQHLVRLEGARCVVLSRDGAPTRALAWTDVLLLRAGEVVDVLLEPLGQESLAVRVRDVETPATGSTLLLHLGR